MINILNENENSTEDIDLKPTDLCDVSEIRGKMVRLKPEREEILKAEFDCAVVHDFGDEYHLTEEERRKKYKFYDTFKNLSLCKHKYRKLEDFVFATREALKCLDAVAENNGVFTPEKFKKMYFNSEIEIGGLFFPEFRGRERKKISIKYLTEFILSDEDVKKINPDYDDEFLSSDDLTGLEDKLFEHETLKFIVQPETEEEIRKQTIFFDSDNVQNDNDNFVLTMNRNEIKKFIKMNPSFIYFAKESRRKAAKTNDVLDSYIYDLTKDDIERIAEYDKKQGFYSASDMPEFTGNLMKDKDYNLYLHKLDEWEETQIKRDYHGKLKTEREIQELELKKYLESKGWNVRNLYGNKEREKKLERIRKEEKEKEKKLREKLVKIQNRKKRRMGKDTKDDKKNKKTKKSKKEKEIHRYKKETKENIDEFLLAASDNLDYADFKDYKEDISDWSWENIIN